MTEERRAYYAENLSTALHRQPPSRIMVPEGIERRKYHEPYVARQKREAARPGRIPAR